MASKSAERKEPVTRGTGNVFADLGFPDAAERQARLRLAYALNQELEARKISQADAAKVLGVTQPKVSALRRYKLEGFSVERLMNLLTALDQDVEIVIRRKPVTTILEKLDSVGFFGIEDSGFAWGFDSPGIEVVVSVDGITHRLSSDGSATGPKSGTQAKFVQAANEIDQIIGARRWVE
jgi:predicted XRE-type DNA-binding protein